MKRVLVVLMTIEVEERGAVQWAAPRFSLEKISYLAESSDRSIVNSTSSFSQMAGST